MVSDKNVLFLCALMLLSLCVWSQPPKTYAFTHYKISDGLASNVVYNAVQDHQGFMWLSTINGLQRFDGNKFITFKSDTTRPHSLPSDDVTQVYADGKKNLWVLTNDNKVGIFNTSAFTYREVPVQAWTKGNIYAQKTFVETSDGKLLLYINFSNRVFEYNPSANVFVPSTLIQVPNHWKINFLIQDQLTQKFYITTDSGFVVFNPKTKNVSYPGHNTENEQLIRHNESERFLKYLFLDSSRRLFFEQWPQSAVNPVMKVFDMQTGGKKAHNLKTDYNLGFYIIFGVLQQRSKKVWICGLPFLAEYTDKANPFLFVKKDYNKERDLKFNRAFSMYEDRQANVWVCTDYGLYLFNPDAQLFQSYMPANPDRNLVEGRAQTALQLPGGAIWVGHRDLGLYCYDKSLNPSELPGQIKAFTNKKSVWDIHQHSKTGMLLIGLQGGQLVVYDTATKNAKLFTPHAFERRAVTQIAEDKLGNIWFGTQGGNIVKWQYSPHALISNESFTLVTKTGIANKVFVDNRGYVWTAGFNDGLLKIDPQTNQVITRISKGSPKGFNLWNNAPDDIAQYNDSLLIVASGALNLINLNNNQVKHITTREGLPSNTVMSLASDKTGTLWLGTLNGLCRADLGKSSFVAYDQNDGLPNEDFNVAGAFMLNDGRMLFTSVESFVVFDPAHARTRTRSEQVFITDFKVSNVSFRVDSLQALDHVSLSYNKNSVSFEYSALNYSPQTKLDYYYKLQGFDKNWIKGDDRHRAIYNFLPPGKYRFEVTTKNMDGRFGSSLAYLNVWVAPPFWETWWFYTLILLLIFTILYLIDRERMRRLTTLQNVRTEIANHLHYDVSTTLNNINVLSQIAKLKADKDIDRSKELIDEISDKSYNMVVNMDEILWSIDPTNDTMEKTLLRLFEYAQTLETNYGAAVDIVVHEKVKDLRLDMKVRHDFFIVCKESLQGLVQQAGNKNVLMDIDLVRSRILLKVLSGDPETGHEASLMHLKKKLAERAAAMHARLNFESSTKETSIILSIPFK